MLKISHYSKLLLITSITSSALLFALLSTNINAGQQGYGHPGYGYGQPGYGYGYRQPMPHKYRYDTPRGPGAYSGYGQYQRQPYPAAQRQAGNTSVADTGSSVRIAGMQFQPATLNVKAGEEVTWMNAANMPHTVTSRNGDELASSRLGNGSVFSHTFNEPGTYTYYCAIHPSMTGTVIVE